MVVKMCCKPVTETSGDILGVTVLISLTQYWQLMVKKYTDCQLESSTRARQSIHLHLYYII